MTGLSTQDSEGPELARAGVQSRQSVASSAPPGRGGTRPPKPERQRTVSLGGSSPPGQQAGQRNFLKWREENRLARGRLRRSPPDTPCAVPPGPPGLPSASPSAPAPTPVAPWREATRLTRPAARGAHARGSVTYLPRSSASADRRPEFSLKSPEAAARKASALLQLPPPLPPRPLLRSFRPRHGVYLAPARSAPSRLMTGRTIEARGGPERRGLESQTIEMAA